MKIIDFEKKGNVVRFYLGSDNDLEYWGDDWNDRPYDCNAGTVYSEYIKGYRDIVFPFDDLVLEPCEGVLNCNYSKEDMKKRVVPCIIVVPKHIRGDGWCWDERFDHWVGSSEVKKFYFGDLMDSTDEYGTIPMEIE